MNILWYTDKIEIPRMYIHENHRVRYSDQPEPLE